jgi:ABC-2 type transport system ATP-binding protein
MTVVRTEKLTKEYKHDFIEFEYGRMKVNFVPKKTRALIDLDLEVQQGEIFGLLGPNGAGKTTSIKILMSLIYPTKGKAWILDKPLDNISVKTKLGYLPENPYFYDYLKGWEFLDFYGQLYGLNKSERLKKAKELLKLVGIDYAANLPLKGYSKGMLQRIGLAQTLLNNPTVVILDEPLGGLDPFGRKEMRDIILSLKEKGVTVFFSSHILSDVETICDRVAILYKGRLKALGKLGELLSAKINEWEITAEGLEESKISDLKPHIKNLIIQGKEIFIVLDKPDILPTVLDRINRENARLVSLVPRKETLEEYFIRSLGGNQE